jgi:hypothetical protein
MSFYCFVQTKIQQAILSISLNPLRRTEAKKIASAKNTVLFILEKPLSMEPVSKPGWF